ncbi:MAG: hypothetical protein ABL895_10490 [Cyclobacteriaceae bacterium]
MKNFKLLVLFSLISCASDGNLCPEKWQLVKMTGNVAGVPPSTGSNMGWQECYLLYPDNTFKKIREQNNQTTEVDGSYKELPLSDGVYLELVFKNDNNLIGSCSGDKKELLKKSTDQLISTWWNCDGPGLFYEKTHFDCVQ